MKNLEFRHDQVVDYFQKHYQDQADRAIAELAVLQLVSQREIAAMTGADLLGMHLTQFVELMTRHGIPYFTEPPRDKDDLTAQYTARRPQSLA